jgi:hypothetical protein
MVTRDEYAEATERGKRTFAAPTAAVSAHYDRARGRIVVRLRSGLELSFSPKDAQGLEEATPAQLSEIEITPMRDALLWPQLDEGLWIPGLLEGAMGSRKWMAARLGQAGGQATTLAKKAASRANGKLGGRPRKTARRG